jgi:acyl-CoA thioesterase-2
MPQSVTELVDLLDLEEIEVGLFRGKQPETALQRVFGGQVLAQSLVASSRTVPTERRLHSMHAYFIRPGRTDLPIVFDVENVRDGRSFSARRAVARQGGAMIFFASSSFHAPEDGVEHEDAVPTDLPSPEDCPILSEVLSEVTGRPRSLWESEWGALEVRYIGDSRPHGILTDPALDVQAASLDHAMWFHRPFRADQWLLYDQVSPSASSALGLSTARLFQDGRLVCTVAQEGLIRPLRKG